MTDIYVFGSNLAGRHGAGSAKEARKNHGAVYGRGSGRQGNSYAIPTKGFELRVLPLRDIKLFVDDFIDYANAHKDLFFNVVRVGCGHAGYKEEQIAPLFINAPSNCRLPPKWRELFQKEQQND